VVIANAPGGLRLDRLPELEISNGIAVEINYVEPPTQIVSLNP
jgi:hypothetical protein